jgi:TRAP-type C4-dicarboxylate transport system permease small subunit
VIDVKVIKWLDEHFEETILVVLLIVIATVMLLQIFMRYIVNSSLPWPEEFARYCYIWTAFFSVGLTIRNRTILRVDIVTSLLPKVIQRIIEVLVQVFITVFFGVLFYYSLSVIKMMQASGQTSPALRLPMYLVYLCTSLGFFVATIRGAQATFKAIKGYNLRSVSAEVDLEELK